MCSLKIEIKTEQIGQYLVVPFRRRRKAIGNGPQTKERAFSLGHLTDGRWETSLLRSGKDVPPRKQFQAGNLQEAVEIAERHWFGRSSFLPGKGPEIGQVLEEWLETLSCSPVTIETDYQPRVETFLAWCDQRGFVYWTDLHPSHIQTYANEDAEQRKRSTIERRCRVIRRASEYVKAEYPEHYRELPFNLPKGKDWNRRKKRDTFTLEQGIEFLFFLREQLQGWNILPGLALQILCSMRLQEVRVLRWPSIDLQRGTVTNEENPKAGVQSHRTIPLCGLAWDILEEAHSRRKSDQILVSCDRHSFGRGFSRCRDRFLPGFNLEPSGLRRTLVSEFFRRRWYGDALQVYRGHKPRGTSTVDWEHYIEFNPEGLMQLFLEHVVNPLDEVLQPYRERWNGKKGTVVKLRA